MEPKVSVIVPVYNAEKYLRQCLDSIVNQTLGDIEIICVDDGSTDGSLSILKEYAEKDERIFILQQPNLRAGVARNNGLKIAKGKYLSFLDSDDFFELDMLEKMYNKIEEDKSDIVICSWNSYDERRHRIIKKFVINEKYVAISPFRPIDVIDTLFDICKPNAWTKLFNRDFFVKNGLHFEDCICCNDLTCVCTALSIANKISVMEDMFIHYRICHSNSLTSDRRNHLDAVIYAINKLEENLKKFKVFDKFRATFLKKAVDSFKCTIGKRSKADLVSKKILAKKDLVDDVYCAIYGETKQKSIVSYSRLKFF